MEMYYRIEIGPNECFLLSDGHNRYDPRSLFANAPEDILAQALIEYDGSLDGLAVAYNAMAIKTESGTILLDTGIGKGVAPTAGQLIESLEAAGLDRSEVHQVVLTHGHIDHIGGLTEEDGQLVYPQAEYFMHQAEWDFWTDENNLKAIGWADIIPLVFRNLKPIADKVTLIDSSLSLQPGIELMPSVGHTPGHLIVKINPGSQELWFIADAIIHPLQVEHPEWTNVFDRDPARALETSTRLMEELAEGSIDFVATHFPFPGIGRLVRSKNSYTWQPH